MQWTVTKKKDGKSIRVLLDGRLLNHYMQRLPVNLVTHPEPCWRNMGNSRRSFGFLLPNNAKSRMPSINSFLFRSKRQISLLHKMHSRPEKLASPSETPPWQDPWRHGTRRHSLRWLHHDRDRWITGGPSQKVGQVLGRLKKCNIKIRPQKISVAKSNVDFLGVVWQKGKLSIPEAKLLACTELLSPKHVKKDKRSIGNDRVLPIIHTPLCPPGKTTWWSGQVHPKQFKWTNEHETCFRFLIEHVKKHATQHLPNPKKPYYVQTDALDFCGAGKKFQKNEEGDEKIFACI